MSAACVPTGLALGGLSGCKGEAQIDRALSFASLTEAEAELSALHAANDVHSAATWTWAQTLTHCAQSIEYSMTGYPALKSKVFRSAIGPAALEFFSWRGRMTHDLAEPIPGAPVLAATADPAASLARLKASIAEFRAWNGPLQTHFAYGELDKSAYERAHAMHIANHLSQFQLAG